jgi:phosphatidylglycerophosphatase A
MNRVALLIATAGYVGYAPIAPGTAGAAVGLVAYAAIRATGSATLEVFAILAVLVIGTWSADRVERRFGKDPGLVVIDEVVGMLVTLAFIDLTLPGVVIGFLVFRVFDIIKPFPAGRLENLHGGPGIMLDDVVAGLYGNILLRVLIAIAPGALGSV